MDTSLCQLSYIFKAICQVIEDVEREPNPEHQPEGEIREETPGYATETEDEKEVVPNSPAREVYQGIETCSRKALHAAYLYKYSKILKYTFQ